MNIRSRIIKLKHTEDLLTRNYEVNSLVILREIDRLEGIINKL